MPDLGVQFYHSYWNALVLMAFGTSVSLGGEGLGICHIQIRGGNYDFPSPCQSGVHSSNGGKKSSSLSLHLLAMTASPQGHLGSNPGHCQAKKQRVTPFLGLISTQATSLCGVMGP